MNYTHYTLYNLNMEAHWHTLKSRREIVALLQSYMQKCGYNSNSLARKLNIPQPTVYRALIPDKGRVNNTHLKLCAYADISPHSEGDVHPEENLVLMSVLQEVWDGTERHARALARLLRSARDVQCRTIVDSKPSHGDSKKP